MPRHENHPEADFQTPPQAMLWPPGGSTCVALGPLRAARRGALAVPGRGSIPEHAGPDSVIEAGLRGTVGSDLQGCRVSWRGLTMFLLSHSKFQTRLDF